MLTYALKTLENENYVTEHETGYDIPVSGDYKEAKSILRNLNMGGGFDGFTPSFFCIRYKNTQ